MQPNKDKWKECEGLGLVTSYFEGSGITQEMLHTEIKLRKSGKCFMYI